MKSKRKIKLYDLVFPFWLFPIAGMKIFLLVLIANFIIDSVVCLISLKAVKIEKIWKNYIKSIIPIWGLGLIADTIGTILYLIFDILGDINIYNPYEDIFSLFPVAIVLFVTMLLIYRLNVRVSFKYLEIDNKKKEKLALIMAITTTPYIFLIPTFFN